MVVASAGGAGSPLPREAYVERSSFELDLSIFRRSWLALAHVSELGAPGSFVASDLAGERVVVVRGPGLELAGFFDGCVHRGTLLFPEDAGRLERLTIRCRYHGLRYDLRGVADRDSCPAIPLQAGAALRPVRVAERLGFVFVCLDPSAPDIDEWMGAVPPWLQRAQMFALRLGRRVVNDVSANWKLCVENFQESHHFTLVHPSLEDRTPWRRSASLDFGGAFLGGTMEIADGAETVSDDPSREGRPLVAHPDDQRIVHDALLVPGWMTSLQPDYFLSYRLLPLAADRTRIVADIYFHASAFVAGFDARHVYSFWDRTNAEDRSICELQQRGLSLRSTEPGPYASVEDGVRAFDDRIRAAYGGAS